MKLMIVFLVISNSLLAATINLNISKVAKEKGTMRYVLHYPNANFPHINENALAGIGSAEVKIPETKIKIDNLENGVYALGIFQDVNNNEKFDLNFLGIPKEPFALSNNPPLMSSPTFEDCQFNLEGEAEIAVDLKDIGMSSAFTSFYYYLWMIYFGSYSIEE